MVIEKGNKVFKDFRCGDFIVFESKKEDEEKIEAVIILACGMYRLLDLKDFVIFCDEGDSPKAVVENFLIGKSRYVITQRYQQDELKLSVKE